MRSSLHLALQLRLQLVALLVDVVISKLDREGKLNQSIGSGGQTPRRRASQHCEQLFLAFALQQ